MKLVLRILPTVLVLTSITAFADNLNVNVFIGPNFGSGDNVGVQFFGQGVSLFALGGTPGSFFDGDVIYFPGDGALGPTMVLWDSGDLQIGSTDYEFGQFDLVPTNIDVPSITFPTKGKDFTVTVPDFVWELDGTIVPPGTCPSSGCNFSFVSRPGTLRFSFTFAPEVAGGTYFARSASFSTPEPGTLGLMAAGLAGILGLFKKRKRPAPTLTT